MPSIKLNGIVTRYADYKDNDRMLTLFTYEQGLVSCARAWVPPGQKARLWVQASCSFPANLCCSAQMISLRWTAPKYPSTIIRSGRI